ncbi:hypothetical protein V7S43_000625 [Phytophthora oleae]|uniref:Uncharacterized protein n=1 Tax=Phytophthora oleae TaxID=2107226 RepID=A0ABD3G685_9STRA
MTALDQWWYNLRQGQVGLESTPQTNPDNSVEATSGGDASDEPAGDGGVSGGGQLDSTDAVVSGTSPADGAKTLNIKLTGNIRRVGRPKLNRALEKEKGRAALKSYNRGIKLRGLFRDMDICDIVASCMEINPFVIQGRSLRPLSSFSVVEGGSAL